MYIQQEIGIGLQETRTIQVSVVLWPNNWKKNPSNEENSQHEWKYPTAN